MFDKSAAALHFSEILKYKTIKGNDNEFVKFRTALKAMYPNIHKTCLFELIGKGIVYRWQGKINNECVILMAHYDVVPANAKQWVYPPFSGTFADEKFWSRGSLDTKCTLCAIMESVETLISRDFVPETDIYLCFGGDEETEGFDAINIASELKHRGIKAYLILDEGGAVVDGSSVGINYPCALIGIAEKGYMDVEFITRGSGGHSSLTSTTNPIVVMAEVIKRLDCGIFKPIISKPVKLMLKEALKFANLKYRFIFRNYWFWGITFRKFFQKSMPEINALINNIGTITQISGGSAENVIPEQIRAVGNFRIISSVYDTLNIIKKALTDLNVEINLISGLDPSPVSETSGKGWEKLTTVITKVWNNSIIIPHLMLARSDSRSYFEISSSIYRFSPITLTKDDRRLIHGVNENISKDNFYKIIEFYIRLITGE